MLLLHIYQLLCPAMLLMIWSYATGVWGRAWMLERLNIVKGGGGGLGLMLGTTTVAYFFSLHLPKV